MIKKFIFISLIFLHSCGYQPIYINKNLQMHKFSKISIDGDEIVNKRIVDTIGIKEDLYSELNNQILITSNYDILETSRDTRGIATSYRSTISVIVTVKTEDQVTKSRNFKKSINYNNFASNFELIDYQKKVKSDLTDQIIEDIVLYMNVE